MLSEKTNCSILPASALVCLVRLCHHPTMLSPACPRLIVALDVDSSQKIREIISKFPPSVEWFKIGLEAFCAEGLEALKPLVARKSFIFLDLKLHDIPRTVERAVRAMARQSVHMLTIHAAGGRDMIRAASMAAREFGENRPRIVAVTALTSLNQRDLAVMGVTRALDDHVRALAELAVESGADGVVCSALEASDLRRTFGRDVLIVTPGIRATTDDAGDQKRTCSAAEAVKAGASHLVIGRPILDSPDPAAAAIRILADIAAAYAAN
jgi:orotidine-5'-phosphate decarboxylase